MTCPFTLARSVEAQITGLVFFLCFLSVKCSSVPTEFLVYVGFRTSVHVIDHTKKAVLGRLLVESVASMAPGETLDEKLAALTFSHSDDVSMEDWMLYNKF